MKTTLLMTAFEPSGDTLAAAVIDRLGSLDPSLEIHGWGGPGMEAAGAVLHENTVAHAAMGLSALAHIKRIRGQQKDIRAWARDHRPIGLIPVDSPAANFPICKALRPTGVKVIHLAAPQLWAWAPWRAGKLRRCTDLVLCLLPFEPDWFARRRIPATFVGHPAIDRPLDQDTQARAAATLPQSTARLVLMPGSRSQEIERNVPLMCDITRRLRKTRPDLAAVMTAVDEAKAARMTTLLGVDRSTIAVVADQRDAAIHWAQVAVAVSGTVSLDIMRHRTPMVGLYRTGPVGYLGAKAILTTRDRLLPNLIAGRRIVPEFVPHIGSSRPIVAAVAALLDSESARASQSSDIDKALEPYARLSFADTAARSILNVLNPAP